MVQHTPPPSCCEMPARRAPQWALTRQLAHPTRHDSLPPPRRQRDSVHAGMPVSANGAAGRGATVSGRAQRLVGHFPNLGSWRTSEAQPPISMAGWARCGRRQRRRLPGSQASVSCAHVVESEQCQMPCRQDVYFSYSVDLGPLKSKARRREEKTGVWRRQHGKAVASFYVSRHGLPGLHRLPAAQMNLTNSRARPMQVPAQGPIAGL